MSHISGAYTNLRTVPQPQQTQFTPQLFSRQISVVEVARQTLQQRRAYIQNLMQQARETQIALIEQENIRRQTIAHSILMENFKSFSDGVNGQPYKRFFGINSYSLDSSNKVVYKTVRILGIIESFPSYREFLDSPKFRAFLSIFAAEKIKGRLLVTLLDMCKFLTADKWRTPDGKVIDIKKIEYLDLSGIAVVDHTIFLKENRNNPEKQRSAIIPKEGIREMVRLANLPNIKSIIL